MKSTQIFATLESGDGGNRTPDTRIFSPLLYQLSYITGTTTNLRPEVVDRGTKVDKFIFGAKAPSTFLGNLTLLILL
jgi:hypothetical protein